MQLNYDFKYHGVSQLPEEEILNNALSKVKLRLFQIKGAGFLGTILSNTEFHWNEDIPTAATNGEFIIWNPYFFWSLSEKNRLFVLLHEIWHIAYQHSGRVQNREPELWNIAADHVINLDLMDQGILDLPKFPFELICDIQYKGKNTEEVYDILYKKQPPSNGSSNGDDPSQSNQGKSDPSKGDHMKGDHMADVIPNTDPKAVDDGIRKIIQATQVSRMAGEAGIIPGDIEQVIQEFLNPELPWNTLIEMWLNDLQEMDYTYRFPSKRHEDPIMPGLRAVEGRLEKLSWFFDVSGSMTDHMIQRIASELVYVKRTFNPTAMDVIQFDATIQKVDEWDENTELKRVNIQGRGGTSLKDVYKYIKDKKPTAAIIFSDMQVPPMPNPHIPILWVVIGKGNKHIHDYGMKARMK